MPFTRLDATAAALPLANIDTDRILPGRFLKTVRRAGLGEALFAPLRYAADGTPRADFVLNRAPWTQAGILVACENFGCGSSREHAPWALLDFGIRAIVAPGFADIFRSNCIKNGILPAVVDADNNRRLLGLAASPATCAMTIDLERQTITPANGRTVLFRIDPREKRQLLSGACEISGSLACRSEIQRHEEWRRACRPWVRAIEI